MNNQKPPFESILALQKEMERLHSPFKQLLDEQQRIRDTILGPSQSVRAAFDQILEQEKERRRQLEALFSTPLQQASEAIRALASPANSVKAVMEQWPDLFAATRGIASIQESVRNALDLSASYREAAERLSDRDAVTGAVLTLNDSARYVRELLATLSAEELQRSAEAAIDWATAEQQVERVQDILAQAPAHAALDSAGSPRQLTAYEWVTMWVAVASVLLALAQVMLQIQADRKDAQESVEERTFRESLLSALQSLQEQAPREQILYVVGPRNTYVKSTIRGGVRIGQVHPNQLVVVTDKEGRWVKVRFRDYIEEREIEGWILKHYLIRIGVPSAERTPSVAQEG